MAGMTRKFNGKVYDRFDFAFTKREAVSEAKGLRKKGKLVRLVKAGDGYAVWVR